ncbi:MAG: HD domain-containing protein, partial [Anaerolineales bacterium]|nr:HD domain-containing protein [Anaerolineales bacterium]
ITSPTSRFEHSVGALLLVRRLGASLEEQVAALLHDISHTAFSHVIDYVFDGHTTQGYHEEHKLSYVSRTDVPAILERRGYNWLDFMPEENYTLLEQDLPHLCADRLDYFLRDSRDLDLASDSQVSQALCHLAAHQGRIIVDDLAVARWLGYTFIQCDQTSWANFREVGLYELAARAIRRGLALGVLTEEDIWGTDQPAWDKLRASKDPDLQYQLNRVHPDTRFVWDQVHPEFRVSTKLRSIDPNVLLDGQVMPLSALDQDFARHRSEYRSQNSGEWPMRVIAEGE